MSKKNEFKGEGIEINRKIKRKLQNTFVLIEKLSSVLIIGEFPVLV